MESVGKYSMERKAFDTPYRIRRINALRQLWDLDINEYIPVNTGSSIGIEIEMTWPQAFPDMYEWDRADKRPSELARDSTEYAQFSEDYDQNDRVLRPVLEQAQRVIPRVGRDAYWEFSFLPTTNTEILVYETSMLYEKGILRDGIPYAMHMTISGVDNDRDAYTMLTILEMEGAVTRERLQNTTGWARKGDGGLRKRNANELLGTDTCAYEFRTFVCLGVEHLREVLTLAQGLKTIHSDSPEIWTELRDKIETLLRDQNLPVTKWDSPVRNPEMWQRYINAFIK